MKGAQSSSGPIALTHRPFVEGKLPPDSPDSDGLRLVAAYLEFLIPASDALSMIEAKDYTAGHETVGFHHAIRTIREWADDLDDHNRLTSEQESHSL